MTVLANPAQYNERVYSNSWCGQSAGASVATNALQRTVSPPEFNAHIPSWGFVKGGTSGAGLTAALLSFGVQCVFRSGDPMETYLSGNLDKKQECILLHQCNGYAQPVPAGSSETAHWRVGYGEDDVNIATMNPWGGNLESGSKSSFFAADLQQRIDILEVLPKDQSAPPPPVPHVSEKGMLIASTDSAPAQTLFVLYDIDANGLLISTRLLDIGTVQPWTTLVAGEWLRVSGAVYVPGNTLTLTPNASAFITVVDLKQHDQFIHHDLVTGQIWGPNLDPNGALLKE